MTKYVLFFGVLFIVFITGIFVILENKQERIRIAVCPTYFEVAKEINNKKYEVIKTASTVESLALLKDQKVDMILTGRTLKPHEPQMNGILLKEGYSFLSNKEIVIYINQLEDYGIYTDLNAEFLKDIFPIQKIEEVNDVYEYLGEGIIITSWENTDYTKAGIVHVLQENEERVKLSRQPTIYCPYACEKEAWEIALLIK